MHLTNSQYEVFEKEYRQLRDKREALIRDRLDSVRRALPEYSALEDEMSDIGLRGVKELLQANTTAGDIRSSLDEIRSKKQKLLESAGYPEDYLEPPFKCGYCKDTGFVDNRKCRCFISRITDLLYRQSNLGEVLAQENFDTLSYDYHTGDDLEAYKSTVAAARDFVSSFPSGRNLLFYGSVGTGKTFLSKCITKAIIDKGYSVLYYSSPSLVDHLAGRVVNSDNKPLELYSFDLIIIDDLGTENPNDYTKTLLYEFLNRRLDSKNSLIISTNLDFNGIQRTYSDRFFSRFIKFFDVYKFSGSDIRIKTKLC